MIAPFFSRRSSQSDNVPTVDPGERIYAIGDVHGRSDLLMALLKRINEDALSFENHRVPRLIFLGDYIDRGDDTAQVLEILERLADDGKHRIDFLLGNHEHALLEFLDDPIRGKRWLEFGGEQTLGSYGISCRGLRLDTHTLYSLQAQLRGALGSKIDFLKGLVPYAQSGDVLFTHAGVNPHAKDLTQDTLAMVWGHADFCTHDPVPGLRVVHGHYDAPEVYCSVGRVCADTGAYYTGKLSAVRLDDDLAILEAFVERLD